VCGIAGICGITKPCNTSVEMLHKMVNIIGYRGPDEVGIYIDDWAGLGHTRLSVIDLSGGTQPIHNENKSLWIIYNGEIFNYIELRQQLESKGHIFYTNSDTEVLLHMYEQYGSDCLEQLNGQFAFAIWDNIKRELFAARDHVGILPLYFTKVGDVLLFASEIKSLFINQNVPKEIDPIAIDQIFTFWTTLKGRTVFEGIDELPAGHYLKISKGRIEIKKYWDYVFLPRNEQLSHSPNEVCDNIRTLLLDSINIRLRADVPVGAYLSGGLDSSGITAAIVNNFNNHVRTFGIRFEDPVFDESAHQNRIAKFLKVPHTQTIAADEAIGSSFADCLWHCEKPLLRTAPVPLLLLSKLVSENGFKVVLTGEGADEVFGGYNIFREAKLRNYWAKYPQSLKRASLTKELYTYIFNDKPRAKSTLDKFFSKGLNDLTDPLFSHLLRWQNTGRSKIFFCENLNRAIGRYDGFAEIRETLPESFRKWDCVSKAQYLEMSIFLTNYLLSSQGDRMAMANSLEIRVPYLDRRIIEYMCKIPSKWKILGLNEKHTLKKVFKGILPDEIIKRPKYPYRAPIKNSLIKDRADEHLREMLSENYIKKAGLFDAKKVNLLLAKMQKKEQASEIDNMALAGILSSQIIYNRFIDDFPNKQVDFKKPDLLIDRRSLLI